MKNRWFRVFSAWISVFLLTIAAAAAETYPSMAELYQHWSTAQMPDWVCSVVSADGSSERLAVVVNSNAAAEELTAMLKDVSSVEIAEDAVRMDAALEPSLIRQNHGPVIGILALSVSVAVILLWIRRRKSAAAE